MNKALRQAIMKRSQLKNRVNKTKNTSDIISFNKQRNYVVKLNKLAKLDYFSKLNIRKNTKPFWQTCKLYFSNKHAQGNADIILIENDKIIMENKDIVVIFNSFFGNIVNSLDLYKWPIVLENQPSDEIGNITRKYANHPSIVAIKSNFSINHKFAFNPVTLNEVKEVIKNLPTNKATSGDIPVKILKESGQCFERLRDCKNEDIKNSRFPNCLKNANIIPIFKKGDKTVKSNYRPISILPLLSKVYEKTFIQTTIKLY
ncbi:uncharacterized protein LOC130623269 [Hydractinia symbiolongicarpus]|uniref:uncharacterized protein LOC130623269 n=1 Tax=Hydractinia symbiolongicarpus TaxID=13093 RepID=UPI00254E303C|nr:uncharacterized protein LOC130623269 [Hydractinia symbiolongicarpus]